LQLQIEEGLTVFHIAAITKHLGILLKIWVPAKKGQMNRNDLKKKLLLAKSRQRLMAWQHAAGKGSLKALETLLRWAN
jgi:hypothetical protein